MPSPVGNKIHEHSNQIKARGRVLMNFVTHWCPCDETIGVGVRSENQVVHNGNIALRPGTSFSICDI